jgi:tetratricopeptide (TPR) repeat protein
LDPLAVASNGKVSPAVELFYDRATSQGAHLTEADRPAVESLCRRLDGLPLAIELVAPRTRMVGVGELEGMLGDLLGSPGSGPAYLPERHRTIRAAIDWSMQSLTSSQRSLFSRLAALPAGANLDMLEKVCGHGLEGALFENLAVLVDNSLVTSTAGLPGGTRFGQLALLREYGLEMLRDSGEEDLTLNHLVDYYLEQAPQHASRLEKGSGDAELSTDHANLLAAMQGSIKVGRVEDMARANLGVWVYWFRGDRIGPAIDWVGRAEQTTSSPYLDWLAGFFAFQTGDFETLGVRMAAARSGFADNGDKQGMALARMFGAMAVDDPVAGYEMLEAANEYFTDSHDLIGRLIGPLFQSIIDFQTGDMESSLRQREEGLEASKGMAVPELEAWMYWNLAWSYYGVGRHEEALDALVHAFEYMAGDAYQEGVASSAEGIALLAIKAGLVEKGVQLLGAAQAIFDRIGTVTWFEAAMHVEAGVTELKGQIGDDQYDQWFASGRELGFSEAVDLTYLVLSEMGGG